MWPRFSDVVQAKVAIDDGVKDTTDPKELERLPPLVLPAAKKLQTAIRDSNTNALPDIMRAEAMGSEATLATDITGARSRASYATEHENNRSVLYMLTILSAST